MKNRLLTLVGLLLIAVWITLLVSPTPARAAGVVGSGTPGSCTEAALSAALSGGGVITFDCGPNPHTILITSEKVILLATELDGGNRITLDGGGTTRLFSVNPLGALELRQITLTRGNNNIEGGGGIYNAGVLTIQDSSLTHHFTGSYGGAIYNTGVATISGSTFASNTAGASFAGGIYNHDTGILTLTNSLLSENAGGLAGGGLINRGTATVQGVAFDKNRGYYAGAILNYGALLVQDSTFSENSSTFGGGALYNEGSGETAVIRDSTFALNTTTNGSGGALLNIKPLALERNLFDGNWASANGGAIYNYSTELFSVSNNTFAGNSAVSGGGIYSIGVGYIINSTFVENTNGGVVQAGDATVEVHNTLLAFNSPFNCLGTVTSNGYNLESEDTCGFSDPGDQVDTDPLVGPLADNGGPTWTVALLKGSPAINAASNVNCPATDQRGVPRPQQFTCDIGAYEYDFLARLYLPGVRR